MSGQTKDSRKQRTDGEGSVYQRHVPGCARERCRCPWQGALVVGWRDDKPIRRKVSAATRSGVAAKLRDLREDLTEGALPQGRSISVAQWMGYWFGQVAPRKCRPYTIAGYKTKVEDYIVPLLGHHQLDRLTPEHIETAWDHLLTVGNPTLDVPSPLSPNTVHQTHRILSRALKVAVQRKKLRTNPAGADHMDAPSRDDSEIEPIPRAEIEKILAAAAGVPNAARWSVALAIGLRPGEALGLRWEDVDIEEDGTAVLRVRQTLQRHAGKGLVFAPPKSKAGRRDIVLPTTLAARLRTHRAEQARLRLAAGNLWQDNDLVFTLDDGRPIDPGVDSRRWRALLVAAGVPHRRLYDARHSAATLLLAEGVPVRVAMDILGHSQVQVTMRYQHAVDETKVDAARRIEGGIFG